MRDTTVAARYAKALFMVTEKRGETSRALEDMKSIAAAFQRGSRVANILAAPQTGLQNKRLALRAALDGKIAPTVVVFLDLLLRRKRIGEFTWVVDDFEALVEKALGVRRALVVSAVPLEEQEAHRLHQALEHYTQGHIRLSRDVDPALLGGALVRIGDRVVDRTVRTLLDSIAKQLYEVSV